MKVLAIHTQHNATCAFMDNGNIKCVVSEENSQTSKMTLAFKTINSLHKKSIMLSVLIMSLFVRSNVKLIYKGSQPCRFNRSSFSKASINNWFLMHTGWALVGHTV